MALPDTHPQANRNNSFNQQHLSVALDPASGKQIGSKFARPDQKSLRVKGQADDILTQMPQINEDTRPSLLQLGFTEKSPMGATPRQSQWKALNADLFDLKIKHNAVNSRQAKRYGQLHDSSVRCVDQSRMLSKDPESTLHMRSEDRDSSPPQDPQKKKIVMKQAKALNIDEEQETITTTNNHKRDSDITGALLPINAKPPSGRDKAVEEIKINVCSASRGE